MTVLMVFLQLNHSDQGVSSLCACVGVQRMEVNGNLTRESPVCVSLAAASRLLEENCCRCCCFWCCCWKPTDHSDAQPHRHLRHIMRQTGMLLYIKTHRSTETTHHHTLTYLSRRTLFLQFSPLVLKLALQYVFVLQRFGVSTGLTGSCVGIWDPLPVRPREPETNPRVHCRRAGELTCGVPQGSFLKPL